MMMMRTIGRLSTLIMMTITNIIRGMSCTSEGMVGVKAQLLRGSGRKGTSPIPPSSCSLFASHWSETFCLDGWRRLSG